MPDVERYCPLCDRTWPAEVCPDHAVPLLDSKLVPPPEDHVLAAGAIIGERYVVLRSIGRGGMGRVYAAEQRGLPREVALKVLLPDLARGRTNLKRFYREARALSTLSHPNIVQVFDFGLDRVHGLPFIVMELIVGETLAARLRREAVLSEHDAARLLAQVAGALVEAHGKGVVHRDLKPDNIFLQRLGDGTDQAKVLDFGIARLLDGADGEPVTGTGAVVGTPDYMSPEQASGLPVTPSSDLYSLGCILHTVLVGTPPFSGLGRLAILIHQASAPRPTLPSVLAATDRPPSAEMRELHTRLLAIVADLRPPDAAAVAAALHAIAASTVDPAQPSTSPSFAPEVTVHAPASGPTDDFAPRDFDTAATTPGTAATPVAPPHDDPRRQPRRRASLIALGLTFAAALIGLVIASSRDRDVPQESELEEPPAVATAPPRSDTPPAPRWTHYMSRITFDRNDARAPSLRSLGPRDYELVMSDGNDILLQRKGAIHSLTLGEAPGATDPAVSPDGERIAFSADDGTHVMNIDGSARRRVVPFGRSPAWSPDGTQLAVVDLSVPDPQLMPLHDGALRVVTVASGESRTLPAPPGAVQPDWSPNGRFIAFAVAWRVWLIAADGKSEARRIELGNWAQAAAWRPRFVPGSDDLLAVTYRRGLAAIYRYVIDPDSGQVTSSESVVHGLEGVVDLAVRSQGNAALVTLDARSQTELVALGPDATSGERTVFARSARLAMPAFDNEGKQLIATAIGTDERPYFTDLTTFESVSPIPFEMIEYAWGARMSPDGRWLVFYGVLEGEDFGVWLGPPSGPFRLVVGDHYLPEWSPDSLHLSVVGHDTRPRLVTLDPDDPTSGGTIDATRIGPRWHIFTGFSPNGLRLAEVDLQRGGTWVRDRDSFIARKVWDGGRQALWYDQQRVLVADTHAVVLVDVDSGEARKLIDLGERILPPMLPLALSADGRRLAVVSEAPIRTIFDLSYRPIDR